jgi:hypothetical protein
MCGEKRLHLAVEVGRRYRLGRSGQRQDADRECGQLGDPGRSIMHGFTAAEGWAIPLDEMGAVGSTEQTQQFLCVVGLRGLEGASGGDCSVRCRRYQIWEFAGGVPEWSIEPVSSTPGESTGDRRTQDSPHLH